MSEHTADNDAPCPDCGATTEPTYIAPYRWCPACCVCHPIRVISPASSQAGDPS